MSSKKKNLITLIALSVVLIICLLLYFLLPAGKNKKEEQSGEAEQITVDTITADTIKNVSFEKDGKVVWALTHGKNNWKFTDDASIPVNDEKVTAITDALNPVKATKKIEDGAGDMQQYGLQSPTMTLKVTANDGREYVYQIGMKVPKENMGYYSKSNAGDTIYCLDETLISAINVERNTMIKMDTLPSMESDYMTYIQVNNRKGRDFEAKRVSDREKVDFYSNWNITKPYAKPLATSASEWKKTLGYFNALTYTRLVEYRADNLKKYGLQQPSSVITVTYYEAKKGYTPTVTATPSTVVTGNSSEEVSYLIPENKRKYKTLVLCVGDKTKEGYYVCEKESNHVYMMNTDVVENMTKLDAYESMDHCVYSVLATSIKGYDVTYGDTTLQVTRTSVKEKTDDTQTTATPQPTDTKEQGTAVENTADKNQKNIWKLNGKKISDEDENDFLTPYSTAYLLEYTAKAKDSEVKEKDTKPVLTIVYHEEKRDVTVQYLPYDGTNFYRVDKDGMNYFLVDKLLVDDIIEKFKGIEKLAK